MNDITLEGITRRMSKQGVGCVQAVVGKKKFLVKLEYGKKIEMSFISLLYLCLKEEVCIGMDKPIS